MIPSIFTKNNCEVLGYFGTAAIQPLSWQKNIEMCLRTYKENQHTDLLLYPVAVVQTDIDNITFSWWPCTCSIKRKMYLVGLTISNLSSQHIISLLIKSLFCNFMVIEKNNLYVQFHFIIIWNPNRSKVLI